VDSKEKQKGNEIEINVLQIITTGLTIYFFDILIHLLFLDLIN